MIPALHVDGLKVSIRTDESIARVLDDVSVTLEPGEFVVSHSNPVDVRASARRGGGHVGKPKPWR